LSVIGSSGGRGFSERSSVGFGHGERGGGGGGLMSDVHGRGGRVGSRGIGGGAYGFVHSGGIGGSPKDDIHPRLASLLKLDECDELRYLPLAVLDMKGELNRA